MYRIKTFNTGQYLIETYWNFLRMVSPKDELLKYYNEGKLDIPGIKKLFNADIEESELIAVYYSEMSMKYQEITKTTKNPLFDNDAMNRLEEFLSKEKYN